MRKVLLAVLVALLAVPAAFAQQPGRPNYTRLSGFRIPYQMADGDEVSAIKEIQLYVAKNRGAWELYTSVTPAKDPDQRYFQFRASGDGEYWFAVRTVDRDGNAVPAKISELQPELRVIVDTKPPQITLTPLPRQGNRVGVRWRIQDPHVKFDSFQIEYRVGEQGRWKPVPSAVFRIAGEATWEVEQPGTVYVRVQVEDQAHNLGIAQVEIPATSLDTHPATHGTAGHPHDPDTVTEPNRAVSELPKLPEPSTESSDPVTAAASNTSPTAPTLPSFGDLMSGRTRQSPTPAQANTPGTSPSTAPTMPAGSDVAGSPAVRQSGMETPVAGPATPTTDIVPANRTIVRHTAVNIDYAVEDVGPSGIGSVQLWYTLDGGKSWTLYGEDPDRRPPFRVDLARILSGRDGLVGFRMVVKSGVGLGDEPPTSGDKPEIWVELDRTPPMAQLIEVAPGQGRSAGRIIIRWRAEDRNLTERPVSLYFGVNGNWKPIATQIANSGLYEWTLPIGQVPPSLRIGLDVIDAAGNRTFVQSDEITIDLSRPRARVTGIAPADDSVRR